MKTATVRDLRTKSKRVDWSQSAAFTRVRTGKPLSAKQVAAVLDDSKGTY